MLTVSCPTRHTKTKDIARYRCYPELGMHLKRKLAEAGTIRGKGKPGTGKKRKRKIEDKYMDIFGN